MVIWQIRVKTVYWRMKHCWANCNTLEIMALPTGRNNTFKLFRLSIWLKMDVFSKSQTTYVWKNTFFSWCNKRAHIATILYSEPSLIRLMTVLIFEYCNEAWCQSVLVAIFLVIDVLVFLQFCNSMCNVIMRKTEI